MTATKQHSMVKDTRARLHELRGEGEWATIAKNAGLSYRTICALSQGTLGEMKFTREVALANALGFYVVYGDGNDHVKRRS